MAGTEKAEDIMGFFATLPDTRSFRYIWEWAPVWYITIQWSRQAINTEFAIVREVRIHLDGYSERVLVVLVGKSNVFHSTVDRI